MGGLFDSGTKQVQQQAVTSNLSQGEVTRLAGITGQQQSAVATQKKRPPPRTVLGVPAQQVGDSAPSTFGSY
jgi:hypothetical protein